MYDLETGQSSWSVAGHSLIVNSVDGCGGLASPGGAPEVVSGARDGCVKVWDPRVKEAVAAMEPESREAARDCWAVAFGNNFGEERCVAAGFDNGDVKMFDLRTNTVVWETNVSNGVCAIEFDRKDIEMNKMVVGALEANFAVYDLRTRSAEEGFAHLTEKGAHKGSTVWQCRHLPQKRDVFATTGGNGSVNVYKYKYPVQRFKVNAETGDRTGVMGTLEELASTTLSTQPIASFDWSADKEGLCVMGSFDQTVRVAIVTNLGTEGQ
jgi:WD40 repeat protein